ncbi:MAG: condensation domain-containing protein, partial [Flavobacteriales bacterium]
MEKFVADTKLVKVDFDPFNGPVIERILPTTEAQREVYVASIMGVDANCAYNESVSLILTGNLDRSSLESALTDLVQRHEALRAVL